MQTGKILWVAVIIAVIPWRSVLAEYVTSDGDAWRGDPSGHRGS